MQRARLALLLLPITYKFACMKMKHYVWIGVSLLFALLILLLTYLFVRLREDALKINISSLSVGAAALDGCVRVETNADWVAVAEPDDSWCKISPYTGGQGVSMLKFSLSANTLPDSREVKIVFYSCNHKAELLLRQEAMLCDGIMAEDSLAVNQPAELVNPAPAPATLTVAAKTGKKPVLVSQPESVKKTEVTKQQPEPAKQPESTKQPEPAKQPESVKQPEATKQPEVPAKQPEPVKQPEQVKVVAEVAPAASDITPCERPAVQALLASAKGLCKDDEQGVVFSLSGSEMNISYRLYKDGVAVSGFLPGKGGRITFPGYYKEGVYTAKSVRTSRYCETLMGSGVEIKRYNDFTPGSIIPCNESVAAGVDPSPIKNQIPAGGGDGEIVYQWYINGRAIPGATGAAYSPKSVSYNATYTRKAHDGTCSRSWEPSGGVAVIQVAGL